MFFKKSHRVFLQRLMDWTDRTDKTRMRWLVVKKRWHTKFPESWPGCLAFRAAVLISAALHTSPYPSVKEVRGKTLSSHYMPNSKSVHFPDVVSAFTDYHHCFFPASKCNSVFRFILSHVSDDEQDDPDDSKSVDKNFKRLQRRSEGIPFYQVVSSAEDCLERMFLHSLFVACCVNDCVQENHSARNDY